jgi:hypothetical protein
MHAPLNHHHPRTIHASTTEPSNPRSRQPTLARQGKKQWRMTSNSIQMPTTLISMARAVLSRTTTRMSVATKTLRPGSSHTSNSSPTHLGSPTMCLVVFTCSFKFAMCVYTVCMHSKVRTHGHDTQTFAYGYITYKPCVFGVNTLSWPWTFTMCWEGTEKKTGDHQEWTTRNQEGSRDCFHHENCPQGQKGSQTNRWGQCRVPGLFGSFRGYQSFMEE